jgi:predicted permease
MDRLGVRVTYSLRRLAALFRRNRFDAELREEVELHLALRRQALVEDGMDQRDADREARRMFGNVTAIREETRSMWSFPSIETMLQDVRYGVRLLRRSPIFTVVSVVSLAIGIGASAAVFSLADAVLLRKLPVSNPDELVILQWRSTARMPAPSLSGNFSQDGPDLSSTSFSLPTFQAMRKDAALNARVFGFAGYMSLNLGIDGSPETAEGQAVSGNYFDALGIAPATGRLITDADDRPDAAAVAVVSDAFWQRRFGRASDAVGRVITMNAIPVTIIGVTPKGFRGTLQVDEAPGITVPLALREHLERTPEYRTANLWWVLVMARLPQGLDAAAARPILESSMRRSVAEGNAALSHADLPQLELLPGAQGQLEARSGMREPLQIIAFIVGIVLLVACAIVANLLLARGQTRRREIAVRTAIGAPRARVVRQLLTEGLLLAALGSGLGLLVARWIAAALMPALGALTPESGLEVGPNWRVIAFTAVLATICTAFFALVPALRSTDVRLASGLQERARGLTNPRRRALLAQTLVAIQVALSVLLLTAAALLVRSMSNLQVVQPGFDPTRVLLFRLDPSRNAYAPARVRELYTIALKRLAAIPGVESASLSRNTLIGGGGSSTIAALPNEPPLEPGTPAARAFYNTHTTFVLTVDEGFHSTMRIPMLRGRALAASDAADAQPVALVNSALARQLFGEIDVVGRRFKTELRPQAPIYEIVGVCADAKYTSLRRDAPPTAYFSYRQRPIGDATFVLKTAGDPMGVAAAARETMRQLDPNLPLSAMRTQEAQIQQSLRRERLMARLATLLGAITVILSGIGLYGLLAYTVTRRTPEIGVRMALGAEPSTVRWMVMRHSLTLIGAGLALGIPTAAGGTRVLRTLLFGLTPTDPLSFVAAAAVLLVVGALAAYLPARRASRVDPVVALHTE